MSKIRAEYIWIDGASPRRTLRSKTKVIPMVPRNPHLGLRRFEHQAGPGRPVGLRAEPGAFVTPDPIRGGDDKLVLCEVLNTDMTPA
jgi:glutamine synthetase